MITSEELYDNFAPYFRSYSHKKSSYIKTVDKLILSNLPDQRGYIADVGSGDGVRGVYLFRKIKGDKLLMIDNSQNMVKLAERHKRKNIEIKKLDISKQLSREFKGKFDIVLCLWNVLGHIPSNKKRLQTLQNIKMMLKEDGKAFVDISNRYNVKHYGLNKVMYNISRDILHPSYTNGDFSYKIPIDDEIELDSTCHFFNPFEIRDLIKKAGFVIEKEFSINYSNGNIQRTFFEGHLFYTLSKARYVKYPLRCTLFLNGQV